MHATVRRWRSIKVKQICTAPDLVEGLFSDMQCSRKSLKCHIIYIVAKVSTTLLNHVQRPCCETADTRGDNQPVHSPIVIHHRWHEKMTVEALSRQNWAASCIQDRRSIYLALSQGGYVWPILTLRPFLSHDEGEDGWGRNVHLPEHRNA